MRKGPVQFLPMEKDDRIAVFHLISGLETGGAEMMLLWSARYHDRRSFRLMVVSLMSGGVLAGLIRDEGVEVREMGQKRGWLSPLCLGRLFGTVREFGPDIIQGHLFHCDILARVLGLFFRKTRILNTRHNEKDSLLRRVVYFLTSPLNGATIVFSPAVREHAKRDDPAHRPIRVATYGIDPVSPATGRSEVRARLDIPEDACLWITVGRLTRQKGLPHLIEAFKDLPSGPGHETVLIIVGEGEERTALEDMAAKEVPGERIRFLGRRIDVTDLLGASDAFVLSSLWEGGPLVVLEAMAAGLPVVATRVGDVSAMVKEGETGLIVDPGDSRALARAMKRVMDLGDETPEWGKAGRKRMMEEFHFASTQRSVEDFYGDLTGPVKRG